MRWALTIVAVLFGIPLLTAGWLTVTGTDLILVHNPDGIAKEISVIAYDGGYIERRDPVTLDAHGFNWMFFTPHVKGGLTVVCKQPVGFSTFPIGTSAKPANIISDVTVDGCDHTGLYRHTDH